MNPTSVSIIRSEVRDRACLVHRHRRLLEVAHQRAERADSNIEGKLCAEPSNSVSLKQKANWCGYRPATVAHWFFAHSPEAPVLCALEISKELKNHPELQVRMGIHSGPVNEVTDLNEQANIAGAGINIAQRVMDCGDAGHILLSKRVADDLEHYPRWRSRSA